MAATVLVLLARLAQALQAVGGDRLQQPVAAVLRPDGEGPVDQPGEHLGTGAADRLGGLQRAAARVHGEAPQRPPLGLGQRLPAPVDHRAERPLPRRAAVPPARKQPEPVVQPRREVPHPQPADAGRRQLQGERQAVQPPADRRDPGRGAGVEREPGRRGQRARDEQPDGRGLQQRLRGVLRAGQPERRDDLQPLPGHAQRLPGRREDPQARRVREQPRGQLRDRVEQVLAVVQDEQCPPPAQRVGERPLRGLVAQAQHAGDLPGHVARPGHIARPGRVARCGDRAGRSQLHRPHAVGVVGERPRGRLQREPGLADTAGARQRHQAVLGEQLAGVADIVVAPDDFAERCGRRGGRAPRRGGLGFEHRLVERGQFGARIDAQLVGQARAQIVVARERLCLPSGPVQRAQVRGAQPFAQRMQGHGLGELGRDRGVLAQFEPRLGEGLQRGEAALLQRGDGRPGERGVGEVGVGGAAPQRQSVTEAPLAGERIGGRAGAERGEPAGVHRVRGDVERVPGRTQRDQPPRARLGAVQHLPQLGDAGLERPGRVARRRVAPQRVDEPVDRNGTPGIGEQDGEERADLRLRDVDGRPVVRPHRERSQHPETHGASVATTTDGPAAVP
ncbi:hypothetical protein SAMN05443665_1005233 [Actinomadura meyerae]|uniref:Uncharacterized protein n=1 Tax=Actinomadura meyerae TaxID=240840 RepID=A0A239FBG8_9ACTN|nr:hypothetical protein SAMN05443665_1005233 [Actinomadura meyerae]